MGIKKIKNIINKIAIILLFISPLVIITRQLFYKNSSAVDISKSAQREDSIFPYDLSNPSDRFKLPHYLQEISGISYLSQNKLACISDEKGVIYVFDIGKEQVTGKYPFGKEEDYEDIEIVNNTVYVLQSNGTILKIKDFDTKDLKVKKYKTLLSKKNDAEGLTYDYESNSLLVAPKGSSYLEEKTKALKGKIAIYQFDLYTKKLGEKPAYLIDLENLKKGHDPKFLMILNGIFNQEKDDIDFKPSGIAVHPITKNIYIIASVGKVLIVLDREGEIIAVKELDKKIFKQPEGICFNSIGDLFVSNEGRDGRGNILKFKYKILF